MVECDEMQHCRCVSLWKGHGRSYSDPSCYRFITLLNALMKLAIAMVTHGLVHHAFGEGRCIGGPIGLQNRRID